MRICELIGLEGKYSYYVRCDSKLYDIQSRAVWIPQLLFATLELRSASLPRFLRVTG
jgi:hypothetical protein